MAELSLINKIQSTRAPLTIDLLRLALGWILFREGTGKLYGWFGSGGLDSITAYFKSLGIPFAEFNAFLVGYTEFLGGIAFIVGIFVRPVAIMIACIMGVAILTAHSDGSYGYPLLILAVSVMFLQVGAGKISLDRWMLRKRGYRQ